MSIHLLLVSRNEHQAFAHSYPRLAIAPYPELDHATLAWIIDCPIEALEFTRVGPIDLVHGGAWAHDRFCESVRWPFLDQPVIYGRAVGIRMGVRWPGECASQPPLVMRALTSWEGRNALERFQDHLLPLNRLHCPVDEQFLRSVEYPIHEQFRQADAAGRLAIRQQVMAERAAAKAIWLPKVQAQIAADRIQHPIGSWLAQRLLSPR